MSFFEYQGENVSLKTLNGDTGAYALGKEYKSFPRLGLGTDMYVLSQSLIIYQMS